MTVRDPGDYVGEIALRIDGIEFAGFAERSDDRPMLAATVGSGKKGVLSFMHIYPNEIIRTFELCAVRRAGIVNTDAGSR